MYRRILLGVIGLIGLSVFTVTGSTSSSEEVKIIHVLIMSGKNNHDWKKTTPMLFKILKNSRLFDVETTEKPDTLTYESLKKFGLVISNWNTWPDNKVRMSNEWEAGLLRYVNEGGGVLSIHAGASSFYDWEAYHRIGIGRWGKETRHGPATRGKVFGFDQNHPITKGMGDFYIMDEIWENTDIFPGSRAIASLSAKDEKDGHPIEVKSVFVNQTGKGRCFFTTLGHDERALLNTGLQTLLLRAAQWCSGQKVTVELPAEFRNAKRRVTGQLNWNQTDTSLTLRNQSEVVWQYNFNNRFGKPYFHPLNVNHSSLTCVSPPDHPWHLGLWFSWKFIDGVNYWEYTNQFKTPETGFQSEGATEIVNKRLVTRPDFSSDIFMELSYRPTGGQPVLKEERNLQISAPLKDGSYSIDEEHVFTALSDKVLLDRTPITGEPGGQSWGGYAGLSIRFNQDFTLPEILTPGESTNCPKCNWFYMGFNGLTGKKAGIAILQNPNFTTSSASWYVTTDSKIPFFYYSPSILFDRNLVLKKEEVLRLKYRIWIIAGTVSKEQLQKKYEQYLMK